MPVLVVQWDVEPWGSWRVWARNEEYEGLVEATCDSPGTPLRAPTADRGLDVYCRDSFFGKVCLPTVHYRLSWLSPLQDVGSPYVCSRNKGL